MEAVVLIVIAQATAALGGAHGGARPAECAALDGGRASNIWERAKSPELLRYCDLLASGAAKLSGSPELAREVLTVAEEADQAIPGRAAPRVLRGRALARLGRAAEALAALESARAKDDRALDEPVTLLTWARALEIAGHPKEALSAYRALLPRSSSLVVADRGPAYVEAGLLAMAQAGPATLDDPVEILRESRRESQDVIQTIAVVALALALDRAGAKAEARTTLADRSVGEFHAALSDAHAREGLGPSAIGELDAMMGLALEGDRKGGREAREAWQRYVDGAGSKGAWLEHARQHLGALGGRAQGGKRP
jgi:tetratricopeptide (TPR) repeat protein